MSQKLDAATRERIGAILKIALVDVPRAPRIAIGKFVGRRPAWKDIEGRMIVEIDEAGKDEVIRLKLQARPRNPGFAVRICAMRPS